MDIIVFSVVIFSAFLQASWNFFAKKSERTSSVLILVGWFIMSLGLVPLALILTDFSTFDIKWLWFILATGFVHTVYVFTLSWAYSVGEISVVFPISRGGGILGTTLIMVMFFASSLSFIGLVGIGAIVFGIMLISLKKNQRPQSIGEGVSVRFSLHCNIFYH